jgi:acetolactate synthase-1/2/3 large subunit
LSEQGLAFAHRIAAATGARLSAQTFNTRVARGQGRYPIERIPYVVDEAVRENARVKNLILIGTGLPVTFFAYPGKPGLATPKDANVHVLARPDDDIIDALARLAGELDAPARPVAARLLPQVQKGKITPAGAAETLAALLPAQAIVIEEAITLRNFFFSALMNAAPHDSLENIGGAIGAGPPLATGAAIAAPGRRVVGVQADGSAMYTIQGLWTQARENLDVTTIVLSNRKYAVLFKELADVGAVPGKTANDLFEIDRPAIDWMRLSESMGVEAARADTLDRFADLLRNSFSRRGPFLIELAF